MKQIQKDYCITGNQMQLPEPPGQPSSQFPQYPGTYASSRVCVAHQGTPPLSTPVHP